MLLTIASLTNCAGKKYSKKIVMDHPEFMLQGHRGTRGLMPENTIPSMIKAVQDGANVLEMDLQFTADGIVVVAHDPFINRLYSLDPEGNEIPEEDDRKHIIYSMNYEEVRSYDVGSKEYPSYPEQAKFKTHIPRLSDLIDRVEQFTQGSQLQPVFYNLEIKAGPQGDLLWHPAPQELVRKLMRVFQDANIEHRYYISSFDKRQLRELRSSYPEVPLAFLTADENVPISQHIDSIGFAPEIFSPYYKVVTKAMVLEAQELGIKIVPWTVNEKELMLSLIKMGVDGIITDYPGVLYRLL